MKMKRIFTEGHWSPYSGKAAEYVHKIQDNVDAVHTNQWILNPKYGFAWMEDNRGWVSVMKPKVFRVAGEKRYGYQVYGLSKDGTLRDKSSNWWDTPEEAQENIKRIFNIDMVQESTRGNMKMKRRIIKERGFSSDEESLIKQALEAAVKAKSLLDDAADTIRDAVGETFLFARLDSHSMDLDDTIDDIKAVLAGQIDATDDEYVPESRKRFGSKFVKESEEETEPLQNLRDDLTMKYLRYDNYDELYVDDWISTDDDGTPCLYVSFDPGSKMVKEVENYIKEKYGDRFDIAIEEQNRVTNMVIHDTEYGKEVKLPKDLKGQMKLPGFDESSIRRGSWFDSDGWLLKPIPMGCIYDLSGSGQKDDQAEYWVEELGFDDKFPRNKAIDWLREFGAWEVEELEQKSDTELAQIVLWEFCNELKEQANEQGDDILEEVGLPIEVEEWEDADWTLFQTELALVSLNH